MRPTTIADIELAVKMNEVHTYVKRVLGDKYPDKIKQYVQLIKAAMQQDNINTIKACLKICELPEIKYNETAIHLFTAAACEIIGEEKV